MISWQQDIDLDQDLDHYDMKEEEPVDGKKSEDDGIEMENLAILEKIRKNQRQDHLNVSASNQNTTEHLVLSILQTRHEHIRILRLHLLTSVCLIASSV